MCCVFVWLCVYVYGCLMLLRSCVNEENGVGGEWRGCGKMLEGVILPPFSHISSQCSEKGANWNRMNFINLDGEYYDHSGKKVNLMIVLFFFPVTFYIVLIE